jgi:transposase, IS30 family
MLFSSRMVSEVVQPFWAAVQRGEFITEAAESVGSYREMGGRWIAGAGGVRPRRGRDLQGRYLSFSEREEIAVGRAAGESVRSIARRLGRSPATVSRELRRNADRRGEYRATTAHARAWERASRPKPAKPRCSLRRDQFACLAHDDLSVGDPRRVRECRLELLLARPGGGDLG